MTMPLTRLATAIAEWVAGRVRWFFDLLYGGVPAEFESAFDLDESVARLSSVTRGFPIFTRGTVAMGEVSRHFVSLQRHENFRNGLGPHFDGEFREVGGRVRLVGRFTLISLAKTFMTIWFGGLVFFLFVAIRLILSGNPQSWWFPLMAMALFVPGVTGLWYGRQGWRDDIAWLSRLIHDALSDEPSVVPCKS
jgi:hypothetical protein